MIIDEVAKQKNVKKSDKQPAELTSSHKTIKEKGVQEVRVENRKHHRPKLTDKLGIDMDIYDKKENVDGITLDNPNQ